LRTQRLELLDPFRLDLGKHVPQANGRQSPECGTGNDVVIRRVAEFPGKANDWLLWWEALTEEDELECRADQLREAVDRPDPSTLRALDVMLWMSRSQKTNGLWDEGSDDE